MGRAGFAVALGAGLGRTPAEEVFEIDSGALQGPGLFEAAMPTLLHRALSCPAPGVGPTLPPLRPLAANCALSAHQHPLHEPQDMGSYT